LYNNQPHIEKHLRSTLETVSDPEIPVLTVLDLGVIREAVEKNGVVSIKLTPTYSGCPAMDVIGDKNTIDIGPCVDDRLDK
jgi:ring-1,2-phenylacetyl-CoA epoxidase subunit PaaD